MENKGKSNLAARYDLTEGQALYVKRRIEGMPSGEAAKVAGYGTPAVAGHRLEHSPKIIEAMRKERSRLISTDGANLAYRTIRELMSDKSTPAQTRFAASKWTLEQAGHIAPVSGADSSSGDKPLHEMTADELLALARKTREELANVGEEGAIEGSARVVHNKDSKADQQDQ